MAARKRIRRRTAGVGAGIDVYGGPVIDPTENVIALTEVEKEHQKELRETDVRHQADLRIADQKYNDKMLEFEITRQRDLATLKQQYDLQISTIVTVQTKTTSDLIATQLEKVTTSLSNQITAASAQQSNLMITLSDRIGKLEQARWEVSGRASVSDPATADSIMRLSQAMSTLSANTSETMTKITATMSDALSKLGMKQASASGERTGMRDSSARQLAIIAVAAAVASPIISLIAIVLLHH
jgi:hypothetical protein